MALSMSWHTEKGQYPLQWKQEWFKDLRWKKEWFDKIISAMWPLDGTIYLLLVKVTDTCPQHTHILVPVWWHTSFCSRIFDIVSL